VLYKLAINYFVERQSPDSCVHSNIIQCCLADCRIWRTYWLRWYQSTGRLSKSSYQKKATKWLAKLLWNR